jgi:replicative DNA helicase
VVEPQLAPYGELSHVSDWGGKLVGAVARIAGLLHMALHYNAEPWESVIALETVEHAIQIGYYLIPHARGIC